MIGDFIHRHHEAHRTKLFVLDANNVPFQHDYVDIMKQRRTSTDNATEHTLNDYWNDGTSLVLRRMDWNKSFPNLEDEAPRRVHMGERSTENSPKQLRKEEEGEVKKTSQEKKERAKMEKCVFLIFFMMRSFGVANAASDDLPTTSE